MKSTLFKLPEYYLILLVVLAGYTPPLAVNPIFIGIAVVLILQLFFKNRIAGLLLGSLFFLINLYFLGAVLSEFNEFTVVDFSAKHLLAVGLTIWLLNSTASFMMIYKYATNRICNNSKLAEAAH